MRLMKNFRLLLVMLVVCLSAGARADRVVQTDGQLFENVMLDSLNVTPGASAVFIGHAVNPDGSEGQFFEINWYEIQSVEFRVSGDTNTRPHGRPVDMLLTNGQACNDFTIESCVLNNNNMTFQMRMQGVPPGGQAHATTLEWIQWIKFKPGTPIATPVPTATPAVTFAPAAAPFGTGIVPTPAVSTAPTTHTLPSSTVSNAPASSSSIDPDDQDDPDDPASASGGRRSSRSFDPDDDPFAGSSARRAGAFGAMALIGAMGAMGLGILFVIMFLMGSPAMFFVVNYMVAIEGEKIKFTRCMLCTFCLGVAHFLCLFIFLIPIPFTLWMFIGAISASSRAIIGGLFEMDDGWWKVYFLYLAMSAFFAYMLGTMI